MTALTFTLKTKPQFKLNCGELTPNKLADLSIAQIKALKLSSNKNAPLVSDFFDVSGKDASQIIFKNISVECDYIGHHMKNGQITVEGNAGDFLGAHMRGGQIICQGNVGDRLGDTMRRGLILIDGDAGAYCGSRMIAGTIGVYGKLGAYVGYGLRRGTFLVTQAPVTQATWLDCGTHTLPFLSLMFNSFKSLESKFANLSNTRVQRWMGDASQNGTGEILVIHR